MISKAILKLQVHLAIKAENKKKTKLFPIIYEHVLNECVRLYNSTAHWEEGWYANDKSFKQFLRYIAEQYSLVDPNRPIKGYLSYNGGLPPEVRFDVQNEVDQARIISIANMVDHLIELECDAARLLTFSRGDIPMFQVNQDLIEKGIPKKNIDHIHDYVRLKAKEYGIDLWPD